MSVVSDFIESRLNKKPVYRIELDLDSDGNCIFKETEDSDYFHDKHWRNDYFINPTTNGCSVLGFCYEDSMKKTKKIMLEHLIDYNDVMINLYKNNKKLLEDVVL